MLDVHPPEERIHGARDFFLHLFTITIGLLIALGLESGVEALHHHHLRKEAEGNIRQELRDNRDQLQQESPVAAEELKNIKALAALLEALSANQPADIDPDKAHLSFHEAPIQDAAWRTASSTGVLTYMEYDEVERFSAAYKEQAMLQSAEEQALEDYLELIPILRGHEDHLTPQLAQEALPYVHRAQAHVIGMVAIGGGTLKDYEDALK
jgi:hypothetical protein